MTFGRGVRLVIAIGITAGCLPAQQKGGNAGGGASSGPAPNTGAGGRTPSPTGTPAPGNPNNQRSPLPANQPQPIFVSGQVVLNDGTQPSEPVVIERVCSTRVVREGYTDSRGRFSLQLGDNRGVFQDASTDALPMPLNGGTLNGFGGLSGSGSDLTANSLWGCELRAALAGYRSDTISLASRRYMDNPDVGTIVLHNLTNVKGFTTSATTAFAPKDARKAFDKAGEAIQRSRPDDAQKELLKAVGMYPKFAAAWYELGRVYERRDHFDEARDAYTKAIAADGNYVNPYERLYLLAAKDAKWQEVAETTDRVLRLNPYDFPGAYYYNALANTQLKKFDAAEKSAREAAKLSGPQAEPRSYYVLGVILANKGDFGASAESLRTFLKASPATPDRDRIEKMISEVDGLAQAKAAALDPR